MARRALWVHSCSRGRLGGGNVGGPATQRGSSQGPAIVSLTATSSVQRSEKNSSTRIVSNHASLHHTMLPFTMTISRKLLSDSCQCYFGILAFADIEIPV